jgi:catechol 2,3-dioxygenase-like lactoylglutathione lyase family enzyme
MTTSAAGAETGASISAEAGRLPVPVLVHVGVQATDLEKTVAFWRDALGLRVVATMPGCYDLSDGHHNYRLFQRHGEPRPAHVSGLPTYLHIGVFVEDVAAAARHCHRLGYEIIRDGVDGGVPYDPESPPAESFKVEDPDGIVIDVTQRKDQWPGVGL